MQHDAVADRLDADILSRQRLFEDRLQPAEVALHRDVETGDLAAFGIEEEHVGLADLDADEIGAARRANDGIGDRRIGDENILDIARQIEHDRFADAERNETGALVAADHLDDRDAGVARRVGIDSRARRDRGRRRRRD